MTRTTPPARPVRRDALAATSIAGLLGTVGAMLALGDATGVGAIALAPWVGLLAGELGTVAGVVAAGTATGLYTVAAVVSGGPDGPFALAVRAAALLTVAVGAGIVGSRLRGHERAERAVAARQAAMIDATLDGFCLTDVAGEILVSNAPLRRLSAELGLPQSGAVPDRLLALAGRVTEPDRFRQRMEALAAHPEAESVDEFELADSGRVLRGYTAPVRDADGRVSGRIWTLRDVTSDRQLERLRDAFVASVSHELRTPLTSISGFLELLGDEEHALSEKGRSYLTVIRRSNERLQRVVDDLLLVTQIEARRLQLSLEPVELAEVAAAAAESARPAAAAKGIALELRAPDGAVVRADPQRLGQVLDNLVSNAVKFTGAGGRVTVAVERDHDSARVVVSDTGVGIPHDEQAQLFTLFFRASTATRRAIPGTGLGLRIARAIVEEHGGTISLESSVGEGTRVTVELPAQRRLDG